MTACAPIVCGCGGCVVFGVVFGVVQVVARKRAVLVPLLALAAGAPRVRQATTAALAPTLTTATSV